MALSNDLISQFVKVTNDDKKGPSESTVYGTIVEYDDKNYVRIDGSDYLTPADTTTDVEPGDRVLVTIKNHSATIIGNTSSPSVGSTTIEKVEGKLDSIEADTAVIGDLVADNVTIKDRLTANEAYISELEADNVTINGKLEAAEGSITKLETEKLDATAADIKYATIENLEATNADIYNLKSTFGDFQVLTTNELTAVKASIESLDAEYANIDFANIGEAAIENFYAKSGVIQDVVISDGQVTGTLAGVTIKGDLIEGGTIVADKLVVQGEDGLYYRLNTDGEKVTAQQTEYNSLSGTIITAKSVTAEKIAVDDLVAFDATIGGFSITEDSIYSGVKAGVNNTTRGVYLGNTGQVAFGDTNNYLKYYKDQNGEWKLEVSAQSVSFGSSGSKTNLEEFAADAIVSSVEEFYQSTSPVSLVGGSWSTTQPIWTEGTYIWRRTAVTYGDGSSEYTPSPTGVCITGNTGAQGEKGDKGDDGESIAILSTSVTYQASSSGTTIPTGTWSTSIPSVSANQYLWSRTIVNYSDGTTTTTYSVGKMGANGSAGKGIKSVTEYYAVSSSNTTAPSSWQTTVPTMTTTNKYLWNYEKTTYTDNSTSETSKRVIGVYGNTGATGAKGDKGDTGAAGADGTDGADGKGIKSITNYYLVSSASSGITASTSGWSTTPGTTTTTNKYLWNYEKITYTDNSTVNTTPHIIGTHGATGSAGKGIKSVTEYYAVSSSNTTAPSSWQTTVPTMTTTNKYLWNYEKTTYTDNSTSETSKRVIGVYGNTGATGAKGDKGDTGAAGADGTDGADGKGIKSITNYYLVSSASSGITASTSGWSTTPGTTTTTNKYLWNYEKITYTDNSTVNTTPHIIGTHGATGSAGADGNGIKSTAVTYQAGSSQTTAPTGTWSSTVPTLTTAKPYLWTRTIITYDDNTTSTSYSVSSTLESFEVGGRNLIRNSDFTKGLNNPAASVPQTSGWSNPTVNTSISSEITFNGHNTLHRYRTGTTAASWSENSYYYCLSDSEIGRDITYTLSYWVYTDNPDWLEVSTNHVTASIRGFTSDKTKVIELSLNSFKPSAANVWEQRINTFTIPGDLNISYFYFFDSPSRDFDYYLAGYKLEYGNKATDWTPAPEDVDTNLNDAIDNVNEDINAVDDRVAVAESLIQALNDTISMLVTDEDGTSLMTQTSTGWTYNMSTVTSNLDQVSNDLEALTEATGSTEAAVEELNKAVAEMGEISTYVNITTVNDQPCIELGASNSDFKVVITNTSIDFMEGTNTVAYINNNSLYITKAIIQEELQQGGFIWQIRSNGNLGLLWKGDE